MRLRLTVDDYPHFEDWAMDEADLRVRFGTASLYHPTKDGWIVIHPLNPNRPIRAEWRDE